MIKKLLIGLGVILVSAGATFGVLYFIKQSQQQSTSGVTSTAVVLDHSKDYGACTLLDTTTIKSALGDAAKTLQPLQDMGIVGNKAVGDGVNDLSSDSQLCIYAFKTGGTLENGYNSGDAFIIERIVYANPSGPQTLIAQIKANSVGTVVDNIGDFAFYGTNTAATGPEATYGFRLEVFIGNTAVRYMIRQPAASATFTAESAKTALTQLARAAKQP